MSDRRKGRRAPAGARRLRSDFLGFVDVLSHEIRTPLAAIKGYAETLRQGADEDPRVRRRFLATIERHADRLLRTVEHLLELAARESRRRRK